MIKIRQSTISSILFPFDSSKATDEQLVEWEQSRRDGTSEHNTSQRWIFSNFGGTYETEFTFAGYELIISGHVDYLMPDYVIEFKFLGNNRFVIWDRYAFQLLMYLVMTQKPVLFVETSLKDKTSYVRELVLPEDKFDEACTIIETLYNMYIRKLVIDNKVTDGRYKDVETDFIIWEEDMRVIKAYLLTFVHSLITKDSKNVNQEFLAIWKQYCEIKEWKYL